MQLGLASLVGDALRTSRLSAIISKALLQASSIM